MNDLDKTDIYRKMVATGVLGLNDPRGEYECDEYFYEWLDDTYRKDLVEEFKKWNCFNDDEFNKLEKLNEVVNRRYEEFHKTKNFTEAMWQEIHDAQQAFLNLPSIKKDIVKLPPKID